MTFNGSFARAACRVSRSGRPPDPANGVVDECIAAIWGASFLFMRMGAPDFGVVPPIARRVARVERRRITHQPPGTDDAPEHAPCVLADARQRMKSEDGVTTMTK
ncbi:hypothetical protein WR30_33735 [Burkholderia contaminans FFH2055]|nr:hypothetical protein NL30_00860 [Burkholderia contaminans]AOL07618.1 hypothetical protein WI95_27520 [Burkholderia contaminans]KKL30426.1 hypothetical protein WR30_33735 [Burkholderia contaminans FFH2055]